MPKFTRSQWQKIQIVIAEMKKLKVGPRQSGKPIIVAMVGLTLPFRKEVAINLAKRIHAVIISADKIRVLIRQLNDSSKGRKLEFHDALPIILPTLQKWIIKQGGNVLVDSDHYESEKRHALEQFVQSVGAEVVFVRVICDFDKICAYLAAAEFGPDGIFQNRMVAIKETVRRLHFHYVPEVNPWGQWFLKSNLGFPIHFLIDTTSNKSWPRRISRVAKAINQM